MAKVDQIIKNGIPSSGVHPDITIDTDTGRGEAKLHIGSKSKENDFKNFFNDYDSSNVYCFDQRNMLEYMDLMKLEYGLQTANRYKCANLEYFEEWYNKIKKMLRPDFKFNLRPFTDSTRYYIRSDEAIFKDIFRRIALPLISNLRIEKHSTTKPNKFVYKFFLEPNWDYGKETDDNVLFERNRIIFGAPGTGKSYMLEKNAKGYVWDKISQQYFKESQTFNNRIERITFHPSYTYSQFIGTYKPISEKVSKVTGGSTVVEEQIRYSFVPGPFLRTWMEAHKNKNKNYLLIIEEINRANVAAVFGDVFQLLDRNNKGVSVYSVQTSEDVRTYLASNLNKEKWENAQGDPTKEEKLKKNYEKLTIPKNMYIWATMNSADQGVFPIDTAFKRRWSFEYIGINNGESHNDKVITFADGRQANWNDLRKRINSKLGRLKNINEDKMIGPFFLSSNDLSPDNFDTAFRSKLLMYLYEDVVKYRRDDFFIEGMDTYSILLDKYDEIGADIFDDLGITYLTSTPSPSPTTKS